jgi:hypothetical protein
MTHARTPPRHGSQGSSTATHAQFLAAALLGFGASACVGPRATAPAQAAHEVAAPEVAATETAATETAATEVAGTEDLRAIRGTLDALYRAFCFDPGGQADWDRQRALFCDGASFVAPIRAGRRPHAQDAAGFLSDFQEALASSLLSRTGFHERITHARIDVFGNIAHAYVVFDGYVPPAGIEAAGGTAGAERMRTRGLDSLQLVRDGQRWLVASFATQYASAELPLPARFEGASNAY